jgi:hypothetical protein
MPKIYTKAKFTIEISKSDYFSKYDNASWTINLRKGSCATVVLLTKSLTAVVTIKHYTITKALIKLLNKNDNDLRNFPKLRQDEISNIHSSLSEAAKNVLSLIKYHLDHREISEQFVSIKTKQWSEDGKQWKSLPSTLSMAIEGRSISPIGSTEVELIQSALDNNITPLLAMRHLHRARLENVSHHKWIDATIAAELAVKEVLIRAQPKLKVILLEVPSPPLDKLYGVILEKYLGERSPYLNRIREGVRVRNRLVHRPDAERIDDQKAISYVQDIAKAIFHLLSLLYPNDKLIKYTAR